MTIITARALRAGRRFTAAGLVAVLAGLAVACGSESTADEPFLADGAPAADLNADLIAAAWNNDVSLAEELIAAGADVNHQDGTQQSAYLVSTSEGYLDLLELTLERGADVTALDSFNGTGLIRAAERGHADVVERLLETEIDVNHINNLGWTALHEAIILGDGTDRYVRTVQLLLDHGADPELETQRDGRRPLDLAEDRGQTAIADAISSALRS